MSQQPTDWQPIETAPISVVKVTDGETESRAYRGVGGLWHDAETEAPLYVQPTHWRLGAPMADADRLRRGFLRFVQRDNKCPTTGKPCREPERCGCHLEMEAECDA